jgi:ADP-ribosylation factor GTPase-activating protein 1
MKPATAETTGILLKIDHWRIKIPSWDEQDKKTEPAKPSQSNDSWDGWDDAKDDGFDSYNSHSPTNKGTNQNGISGGSYWDGGFR